MALPDLPEQATHGDERETLTSVLDYYRAVFARKMYGLDATQLTVTLGPSTLTLGGIWLHMALVEDAWFQEQLHAEPLPEPWDRAAIDADPDWDFSTAHTRTPEELDTIFNAAVERSRATVARCPSLDQETAEEMWDGKTRSLRWLLVHMIEEYARHCGHADLLRESIDGRTGD